MSPRSRDLGIIVARGELECTQVVVSSTSIESSRRSKHSQTFAPRYVSLATKGGLAVVGQALFAGAHFLVNVLLARWLAAEQYGAFALAYSSFILLLWFYSACIYEPVIIFGSGRYADNFREYLRVVIRGNLLLIAVLCSALLVAAVCLAYFDSQDVSHSFFALVIAAPFIFTTWLGRAGFYAQLKPAKAALAGLIYFLALTAFLFVAREIRHLSPFTALVGMGIAGLMASGFFFFCGIRRLPSAHPGGLKLGTVAADHWHYGKWAIAYSVVAWFPDNIYYTFLPARAGLEAAAALRALVNLINPVLHTIIALAAVIVPTLVKHRQRGGAPEMNKTIRGVMWIFLPGSGVYLAILWFSRSLLFRFLYAGKYANYSTTPLLIIGILPVAATAAMILGAGLRALERPDLIFWSYAAATITTVLIGLPLASRMGVLGATAGMMVSAIIATLMMAYFFVRHARGSETTQ